MTPKVRALILLVLATVIWGFSHPIAQVAMREIDVLAYGGLRNFFGALSLLPFALKQWRRPVPGAYTGNYFPYLWVWSGLLAGVCLCAGAVLQLYALVHLPTTQVGFITSLYVSMVPVLAFVISGYIPRFLVVFGLGLGVVGLYFLTGGDSAPMDKRVGMVLIADLLFAFHILINGYFAPRVNTWLFSLSQATTCSAIFFVLAFFADQLPTSEVFWGTILFSMWGILSVGVAYSFQSMALKYLSPSLTAMVFPLQAVVSAAVGTYFLGEIMTSRMIVGGAIIIVGCVVAQFSRDSIQVTSEHKYWKPVNYLRLTVGGMVILGTVLIFIWSFGGF